MKTEQRDPLWLYDTTLRDGAQREGISLSVDDKLTIAHQLDKLGIAFIEGGWPGANPKDEQFFQQLRTAPLRQAEVVAFCSTRRPGKQAAEDPILRPILAAETLWVTLFGKSWDFHVTAGLKDHPRRKSSHDLLIPSAYLSSARPRHIIYDAEHWFDGYKHNPELCLRRPFKQPFKREPKWIVLCDTNGGTLPHEICRECASGAANDPRSSRILPALAFIPIMIPVQR